MNIEVKNLHKKFDREILKNINFTVDLPEIIGITGKSGAGKTTLLRLIAGFDFLDSGEIHINQKLVSSDLILVEPADRNLSYMFQSPCLWPHMTVEENIRYAVKGKSKKLNQNIIEATKLESLLKRYPDDLSGGERKRVSLARALSSGSEIILMDEPFSNLDQEAVDELTDLIKSIYLKYKKTMIIVSHNKIHLESITHRMFNLIEGELNE